MRSKRNNTMTNFRVIWNRTNTSRSPTEHVIKSVLTEESEDDDISVPFDEPRPSDLPSQAGKIAVDVHTCKSDTCRACRKPVNPTFVRAPEVPPSQIRCMPARWWKKHYDSDLLTDKLSAVFRFDGDPQSHGD